MPKTTWLAKGTAVLSTATMACFGLTGMASAQSTITNTGPYSTNRIVSSVDNDCYISNNNTVDVNSYNNQTATTGNATSSENTSTYWQGWNDWNPATWQTNQESFSNWWSGLTNWMADHSDSNNWASSNANLSWTPSGSNWQDAWSNWNPMTWQANGQSYNNWATQLQSYLNSHAGNWMLTWPGSANGTGTAMGGATSGDATNNYNATLSINIINGGGSSASGSSYYPSCGGTGYSGNSGGSISTTGPGSSNTISSGDNNHGHVLGSNTVRYTSGNRQGAYTGAAYGTYNTSGGGAGSGNAGNYQNTNGSVGVSNSGGKGGGGSTPSTPPTVPCAPSNTAAISNTGYDSSNVISSQVSNDTYIHNSNNVSYSSSNTQTAYTGDATSTQNTSGGGAASGNATNNAGSGTAVTLKN